MNYPHPHPPKNLLFVSKIKTSLLVAFIACFFTTKMYAQNRITDINASARYKNLNAQEVASMDKASLRMEKRELSVTIHIPSSKDISKIAVMVGTAKGSNDIFYKEFEYGVQAVFDDKTSYTATGNTITLGLGSYSTHTRYYIKACPILTDGTRTEGKVYVIE